MATTIRAVSDQLDYTGMTLRVSELIADKVFLSGLDLVGGELGFFTDVDEGVAAASRAVVLNSTFDITGINTLGVARIQLDPDVETLVANAGTITKWSAIITTDELTTAHTASETLVITKTGVAAGDLAMVSLADGTNTGGVPVFMAACSTNTVTVTLRNNAISANPFNGNFVFNLIIFKA